MSYAKDLVSGRSDLDVRLRRGSDRADSAEQARDLRIGVMRLARRLRLERDGDDLTLTQLAVLGDARPLRRTYRSARWPRHENVKPPSMTRTVAYLEELGLVTRRPSATDGRQVVVDLTARPRGCWTPTAAGATRGWPSSLGALDPPSSAPCCARSPRSSTASPPS